MNKRKHKIILFLLSLLYGILMISGCEDIILMEVDCSQCYTQRPDYAPMNIRVTINSDNPEVPITIFLGG